MATVFVSPGVYVREEDFTAFASRIGTTKLGVVGEFPKGPAFEDIHVSSNDELLLRFGRTNYKYPSTYVASSFLGQSDQLVVSRVLGKDGFTNSPAWLLVASFSGASSGGSQSASTLAVLRSKKDSNGTAYFDEVTDVVLDPSSVSGNPLANFALSATTGPLTAETNSGFTVSLDETQSNYIAKAFGKTPEVISGAPNLYVEYIYPHFIREANNRGDINGVHWELVFRENDAAWDDYNTSYTNAVTPWIVSKVVGGIVYNLFKVHTRGDGDASNSEVKISIANIDVNNNFFDIIVRKYGDNDAASFSALERWSRLSMDEESSRFIGKIIGTVGDEPYERKSAYIEIELPDTWPTETVPAGFRGYELRSTSYGGSNVAPDIYYKTVYFSGDSIPKTYLGVSELGYTSITTSQVSVRNAAPNVEHDLFQYRGAVTTATTTTLGFHMQSSAPTNAFQVGVKSELSGYTNAAGVTDRQRLKFTVVPYGGFDGWDKYKTYTYLWEKFSPSQGANVQAFKDAIDVFESAENVDINILATPAIDFSNNEEIIKYGLEMVEDRADMIYIMDSPRITVGSVKGTPEDAVSRLETTGIDTSYAATYWPWLQVEDINTSRYVYMAPTFAVVRSLAFTDNKYRNWFAPAGLLRGRVPSNVKRADIKLNKSQKDTLYEGRINPIVDSTQSGIVIWGQKTLQIQESALDRINVRRLLLRVERLIAAASLTLVFEQNDETVRDQFLARVEPILLQIQNQRGITAFSVVMDETNNTADTIDRLMLIGKIQIKPTRAVEFIDLTFQVLPTGANFEEF